MEPYYGEEKESGKRSGNVNDFELEYMSLEIASEHGISSILMEGGRNYLLRQERFINQWQPFLGVMHLSCSSTTA